VTDEPTERQQRVAHGAAVDARHSNAHRLFAGFGALVLAGLLLAFWGVVSTRDQNQQLATQQAVAATAAQQLATQVERLGATPVVQPPAPVAGAPGAAGAQGAAGLNGASGIPGPPGSPGLPGPTGPTGAVGPSGVSGPAGVTGAQGSNGQDGAAGPAGVAGPAGAAGPQGDPGAAGQPPAGWSWQDPDSGTTFQCARDAGSPDAAPTYTCTSTTPPPTTTTDQPILPIIPT
jgi:hypothetical protein